MSYQYVTRVRDDSEPKYKFAEVKYGKIVNIHKHWVPLEEFRTFFEASAMFIDITDLLIDGEPPTIGDVVTSDTEGYHIMHRKSVWSLPEYKAAIIERMRLIRNEKELEPIEYDGKLFDADKDALTRITLARQSLEDSNAESILWTTFDNDHVEMTVDDFKLLIITIAERATALHNRYGELKAFINSLPEDQAVILTTFTWDFNLAQDMAALAKMLAE